MRRVILNIILRKTRQFVIDRFVPDKHKTKPHILKLNVVHLRNVRRWKQTFTIVACCGRTMSN